MGKLYPVDIEGLQRNASLKAKSITIPRKFIPAIRYDCG
jgi:hypothetical protein